MARPLYMLEEEGIISTAVIVTPTLDLNKALPNAQRAKAMAGVACALVLIEDSEPRGEIIPINAGWRAALDLGTEYVVGLDDDAKAITEGWLAQMIRSLESNESFGVAGAMGGCRGGPQVGELAGKQPVIVVQPLASFCMAAKRQVFVDIGIYDKGLIHYGGESDWQKRAMRAGWKVVLIPSVFFEHKPSAMNGEWWAHDRPIYERRWVGWAITQGL